MDCMQTERLKGARTSPGSRGREVSDSQPSAGCNISTSFAYVFQIRWGGNSSKFS